MGRPLSLFCSRPLNHCRSDSYAAPAAQRDNPEGNRNNLRPDDGKAGAAVEDGLRESDEMRMTCIRYCSQTGMLSMGASSPNCPMVVKT
jgi:hypothetical protein